MSNYQSTTNACKLCKPLGASIAFRGIEGAVPFLHGSQGCATYMRRYIISHFNEPIDIASSALGEKHAVYGGGPNLKLGLKNVTAKYRPRLIGIATTCLTETIGDDVNMFLKEYRREFCAGTDASPTLINVSTPSYSGTHMEGFHAAVAAIIEQLCVESPKSDTINLFSGFVSSADIRWLKDVFADFGLSATILPDYSDTLDGRALSEYPLVPEGGTPINAIKNMAGSKASVEFGWCLPAKTGGKILEQSWGVRLHRQGLPLGIRQTDQFMETLEGLSGKKMPVRHNGARGRLIDAMVDGHKYLFGKRAVIYGEEDLVVGLASFLSEIGIHPVLCASGGKSGLLSQSIHEVTKDILPEPPQVRDGADFYDMAEEIEGLAPDIIIGNSKGYHLARKLDIPLIRVGFPIHDRLGGQRILHLGYQGAQALYDMIVNTILDKKQADSTVGYSYM